MEEPAQTRRIKIKIKIDTMVTQITKDSSMAELISSMNIFHQKLNSLASKEYIDKCLQKIVTEDLVKKLIEDLKSDISKQIKSELDKVYDQLKK